MNSTRFPWLVLVAIASMVIAFSAAIVIVTPREVARFAGIAFLLIGTLNVLAHRRFGSQVFRWGIKSVSGWGEIGELGAQRFYLGVGLLMLATGVLLLLKGRSGV